MNTRLPIALSRNFLLWIAAFVVAAPVLHAQQPGRGPSRIGYVYPAGAQRGTSCEVTLGGEFLEGAKELLVSGSGVKTTVIKYHKPLPPKRANELREYLQEARKKFAETGERPAGAGRMNAPEMVSLILKEAGASDDEIQGFLEKRQERADPKRQQNLQISELVTLKIEVAADARTGPREVRLLTPSGASNPLSFCVGSLPEQTKDDGLGNTAETAMTVTLPTVVNGRILPGEVNHFAFQARRGAHLVIAVQARDLIPYLADAVPGWFQPVVALSNAKGKEVAYANDFRFSQDPVLCYEVPEDGVYLLEIKDALYRGREDFVYRITVGEVPFVTGIFPMGARLGLPATVEISGWNLPRTQTVLKGAATEGTRLVPDLSNGWVNGDVPFASDTLPEITAQKTTGVPKQAQLLNLPVIVNGRIEAPGDVEIFAFACGAGAKVVAEVNARRLGSPLDSWLKVTDAAGRQLAFNDDWEDKGAALLTHQADSYVTFTAPMGGLYYLSLGDAQHNGGPEYSYRLRISAPRPDFALRTVPSSLNAPPGGTVPVTVYALRKDGFSGDIAFGLKHAPAGFVLNGGTIPAGQDKVRATLTFPRDIAPEQPMSLEMEGRATLDGREISHPAVPADDMIQAFMYHHLVPAKELLAVVSSARRGRPPVSIVSQEPIKLPAGGTGRVVLSSLGRLPFAMGETKLTLSEPPEGISVENVSETREGVAVSFRTDGKVKPGLRGNLIVEAFVERTPPANNGKKTDKKLWSIGFLPAIPFQVVGR